VIELDAEVEPERDRRRAVERGRGYREPDARRARGALEVHLPHAGVGDVGAHDVHVKLAREVDVVDESAEPLQQPGILESRDALAYEQTWPP
jgi:hypothetical protein